MYQDEVSFKQAGSIFRHWALKGIGCVVKSPPTRKSLKVMGAVTVGPYPKFHFRFVNWFNTHSFLAFLDQLISRYRGRKIHMILDNAKYHKGPKVGSGSKTNKTVLNSTICRRILRNSMRPNTSGRKPGEKPLTIDSSKPWRIQGETFQKIQPISGKSCVAEKRPGIFCLGLILSAHHYK